MTWPQAQQIVITNPCTSNGYTAGNNANCLTNPLNGVSRSTFVSTAAPNISLLANNFKPARAMQVDAGVSQVLPGNIVVTGEFVYVHRYNDRDTIDVNLPATPSLVTKSRFFSHVSISEPVQYDNYKALLLKVEKRLSNRFQMLASYTETRAEECDLSNALGGVLGYTRVCGPDPAERRHRLTVSGIVMLPKDMQLSIIQDWRSSLPANPATTVDINKDGYSTDLPPGVGYDSGCRNLDLGALNTWRTSAPQNLAPLSGTSIVCPHYNNVDLRFTKAFSLGGERRLNLIVQVLNVFDYYDLAGGANGGGVNGQITNPHCSHLWLVASAIALVVNAPSRQVELAVRYDF